MSTSSPSDKPHDPRPGRIPDPPEEFANLGEFFDYLEERKDAKEPQTLEEARQLWVEKLRFFENSEDPRSQQHAAYMRRQGPPPLSSDGRFVLEVTEWDWRAEEALTVAAHETPPCMVVTPPELRDRVMEFSASLEQRALSVWDTSDPGGLQRALEKFVAVDAEPAAKWVALHDPVIFRRMAQHGGFNQKFALYVLDLDKELRYSPSLGELVRVANEVHLIPRECLTTSRSEGENLPAIEQVGALIVIGIMRSTINFSLERCLPDASGVLRELKVSLVEIKRGVPGMVKVWCGASVMRPGFYRDLAAVGLSREEGA